MQVLVFDVPYFSGYIKIGTFYNLPQIEKWVKFELNLFLSMSMTQFYISHHENSNLQKLAFIRNFSFTPRIQFWIFAAN